MKYVALETKLLALETKSLALRTKSLASAVVALTTTLIECESIPSLVCPVSVSKDPLCYLAGWYEVPKAGFSITRSICSVCNFIRCWFVLCVRLITLVVVNFTCKNSRWEGISEMTYTLFTSTMRSILSPSQTQYIKLCKF